MATDAVCLPLGDSLLHSSGDDFLNFSQTSDFFQKTLDTINEAVECRINFYMQRKEKHQQMLDYQISKLNKEKEEYLNKSEALLKDIQANKDYLLQIEYSYFSVRNELSLEEQTNRELKEKLNRLQLDHKHQHAKFFKTYELYTTIISLYEGLLNIVINMDEENPDIITVRFKNNMKNFGGNPYIKLEVLNGKQFKVLEMHPSVEENKITTKIFPCHEIILFINKFRTHVMLSY